MAQRVKYILLRNLIDSTNAYDLFKFIKKNYSGDILPQRYIR